jgi:hypothetical protein
VAEGHVANPRHRGVLQMNRHGGLDLIHERLQRGVADGLGEDDAMN